MLKRSTEFWIWFCACMAFFGWVLSAFSLLGLGGYAAATALTIGSFWFASRGSFNRAKGRFWPKFKKRFLRLPAFLFLLLWTFSLIGAMAHPTIHFDSLSYRLPRVLHWFAEGKWHWIHTPDTRMNVIALSAEWVWAPVMLLTDSERVLSFINLISYALFPGLLFALFTRLGVRRRLAWWWMWLLPSGYCYLFQAGSLATDLFGAFFAVASVVYAFKAWESKSAYYLWISLLAIGFATGAKQTNLLAVPLWFLPAAASWRVALARPVGSLAVCGIAAMASYLPMCLANIHYAGTWKGFKVEPQSPFWSVVGNLFAIPLENLLPPVFPAARAWNEAMERFVETPFGANFAKFENFAHLYRGPSENLGGLGLLICAMALLGLVCLRSRAELARWYSSRKVAGLVVLLPWLLVFAFLASITIAKVARYLAFLYPFLIAGFLVLSGPLERKRWWRWAANLSLLSALLMLTISRQRPIVPVELAAKICSAAGFTSLAEKARSAYRWVPEVRATIDAFHAALPAEAKVAGYVSDAGNLEIPLWHPYGSRRVWRFFGTDSPATIRAKRIEYAIVDHTALNSSGAGTIEKWLEANPGVVIFHRGMPPEPDMPPNDAYLVKLRQD